MTTEPDLITPVAAAAASRAAGADPAGGTAIRAKPIRITLDLKRADYDALNRWTASAGAGLGQPVSRLTLSRALRAMIRATTTDDVVAEVVLGLLRRDQDQP